MSFSLQYSALRRQLSISIEAVLRNALKCCGQMLEVSFQPRLLTRGRGWSRLKIDFFKAKVSGRVKTKPRTLFLCPGVPFPLSPLSASRLPLSQCLCWWCWEHPPGSWETHGQEHHGTVTPPGCCRACGGQALPLMKLKEFRAQPPPFPWPKTRVSPCRRIHFTCFLICWSNRVRSVGKAEITFKFPDSLRRLLSVYNVVTAPRLMCLFYSHNSECTERCYTTATTKVYTRRYLASKPTAKITGCRYMEIHETWMIMFV